MDVDCYLHSQSFFNLAMTCQNILSQQIDVYMNAQGHMETVLTKLEAKIKEKND